jgi:hypothetical protein
MKQFEIAGISAAKQANRPSGLSAKRTEMLCCVCGREDRARQGVRRCRPGDDAEPSAGRREVGHRRAHSTAMGSCRRPASRAHTIGSSSTVSVVGARVAAAAQGQGASKRTNAPRPLRPVRTAPGGPSTELTLHVGDAKHPHAILCRGSVRAFLKGLAMCEHKRSSRALPSAGLAYMPQTRGPAVP